MAFAETGHLCLSTLHANNANQAMERIMTFFPTERQQEIRMQLSLNLRAVVSQRLVPGVHGGRAAALEILLDTPRIKDLIKRGETDVLKDAMEQSATDGCQTFDSALLELFACGRIAREEALAAADSPINLRLRMDRVRQGGGQLELRINLRAQTMNNPAATRWTQAMAGSPASAARPGMRAAG
jgi:twitching motility protein PilU